MNPFNKVTVPDSINKYTLTKEQKDIINFDGNVIINAVAGSGKTTTIMEFAKSKTNDVRILYLAFNKSVKLEAIKKFNENGLENITVETAHSLAFKYVVSKSQYEIKKQGYKTYEIAQLLELPKSNKKNGEFAIANHINRFVQYFCNSASRKVQDLNYIDTLTDEKVVAFVKTHYKEIEQGTRIFLAKMDKGETAIIHDFYLKKFQLQNPILHYHYILFDEGQDASGSMLDLFLQQKAIKMIVGDTHQQIYGWRYAINSLENVPYQTFQLTSSFRFGKEIAQLATAVLELKTPTLTSTIVPIKGKGHAQATQSHAFIARTNLGLLLKAIDFITNNKHVKHIYFEGNLNTYTYAESGTSLYDILNLYTGDKEQIRDQMVQSMHSLDELEEYITNTDDAQLRMLVDIVKEYGTSVYGMIQSLKEKHVDDNEKHKAEIIFTTVHKCKGMEYDTIELVNDFCSIIKVEKIKEKIEKGDVKLSSKLNEEINLLYVAITRAKQKVTIPELLVPKGIFSSKSIEIIADKKELLKEKRPLIIPEKMKDRFSSSSFEKKEQKPKKSFISRSPIKRKPSAAHWTQEQEKELKQLFKSGLSIVMIAKQTGRKIKEIEEKLKRNGK